MLVAVRAGAPPAPGKLVAKQSTLEWHSPAGPPYPPLSLDSAQAKFEVRNEGGRSIEILEIKSGCGCATPSVEPRTIPPGGVGIVEVRAAPIEVGERVATVWLTTDSPTTPQVELNLHIIGRRKPPYLQNVSGELAFEGDADTGDVREIHSYNMENPRTPPTPATVEIVPSILEVEPGRLVQVRQTADDSTVLRHYVHEVRLTGRPAQDRVSHDLILIDPWDASNKHAVRAHVELERPVRAIPARVVLKSSSTDPASGVRQSVTILSKDAMLEAAVEPHPCERCPLRISDVEVFDEGRMITFLVGLDATAHAEGEHAIVIKTSSSVEHLTIPVLVREGHP